VKKSQKGEMNPRLYPPQFATLIDRISTMRVKHSLAFFSIDSHG